MQRKPLSIGPTSRALIRKETPPVNLTPPNIGGTPSIGATANYVKGRWSGRPYPTVSWQWYLNGSAIAGTANMATLVLNSSYSGGSLTIVETATSAAGGPVTATSPVTVVASTGNAKFDSAPSKLGPGITLSNNNLTMACNTTYGQTAMSDVALSGLVCFGFTCKTTANGSAGFCNAGQNLQDYPGDDIAHSVGFGWNSGLVEPAGTYIATVPAGTKILFAVNLNLSKWWISRDGGTTWDGGDPAAGTGGYGFPNGAGPYYAAASCDNTATIDFDPNPATGKPTGYSGLSGSGQPTVSKPVNVTAPTLSGTLADGQTLTIGGDTWQNSPTSYQFDVYFNGAKDLSRSGSSRSISLLSGDVGKSIYVIETATNAGGTGSAQSATYGPIQSSTPFSFTPVTGAALNQVVNSNTITIPSGTGTAISITGGQYSKNGGAYTSSAGTASTGDTITLQQTASNANNTLTQAVFTWGTYHAAWNVTTVSGVGYEVRPVTLLDTSQYGLISNNGLTFGSSWAYAAAALAGWRIYDDEFVAVEFTIKIDSKTGVGVGNAMCAVTDECGGSDGNSVGLTINKGNAGTVTVFRGANYVTAFPDTTAGAGAKVLVVVRNRKVYFCLNGSWTTNDYTFDPVNELHGIPFSGTDDLRYMVSSTGNAGVAAVDCNFGQAAFTTALPTGCKTLNASRTGNPPVPAARVAAPPTKPLNFNQALWDHSPDAPTRVYPGLPATPTYYVDPSAGNDAADGRTSSTPWRTLTNIMGRHFLPGDFVAFKCGTSVQATPTMRFQIFAFGRADAPVCFGSYGTGAKPIIIAEDGNDGSACKIGDYNGDHPAQYIVVDGLDLRGCGRVASDTQDGDEASVRMHPNTSNIEIYNCDCSLTGAGISTQGGVTNLKAMYNYVHDGIMTVNTATTGGGYDDWGANGVIAGGSGGKPSANFEYAWNCFKNLYTPCHDFGYDGGSLEVFDTVSNVSFHHNDNMDCHGNIECGASMGGQIATNIDCHHNIFEGCGTMWLTHKSGGFGTQNSACKFHSNTVISTRRLFTDGPGPMVWWDGSISKSELEFYNNAILCQTGITGIFNEATSNYVFPDMHHDNVFCRGTTPASSMFIVPGSTNPDDGLGVNDVVVADLQLTNMSTRDYRPIAGSVSANVGAWDGPVQNPSTLQANITAAIGPWMTTTDQAALGGDAAHYDSVFSAAGDDMVSFQGSTISWNRLGADRSGTLGPGDGSQGGNYYDRAKIWYCQWVRTGDSKYLTRARSQAQAYVNWVISASFGENTDEAVRFSAPEGVYCYWLDMTDSGNTTEANNALTALGRIASIISGYHLDFAASHSDNRERAYSIRDLFWAWKANAPSLQWTTSPSNYTQGSTNFYGDGSWQTRLTNAMNNLLSLQETSGRWGVYNKPFMNGLLYDTLYTLYEQFTPLSSTDKTNILNAVQKSLDYTWTNQWNVDIGANSGAFDYSEDPADLPGGFYPDLNTMILAGYGWAAKKQSDAGNSSVAATNKQHFDTAITGGESGVNLTLPKMFNQHYESAFRGIYWSSQVNYPVPAAITDLAVSSTTSSGANVTFTNPQFATGYDVEVGTSTGVYGTPTTLTNKQITGLSAGTTYYARVRGKDASGAGAWSNEVSFTTNSALSAVTATFADMMIYNDGGTATDATVTFTGKNIGAAAGNRQLYFLVNTWGTNAAQDATRVQVNIGGAGYADAVSVASIDGASIWRIAAPTGTTADIKVTCGNGVAYSANVVGVSIARVIVENLTAVDTKSRAFAYSDGGIALSVPTNGIGLVVATGAVANAGTVTWSSTTPNVVPNTHQEQYDRATNNNSFHASAILSTSGTRNVMVNTGGYGEGMIGISLGL